MGKFFKDISQLRKIKVSFKSVRGMLLGFYLVGVLFIVVIIVHFFEIDANKTVVRDYHMNLSETVILDNIYDSDDIVWEANSDNVVIENNVIRAINSGETYIIGKVSKKQVADLRISVLSGEESLILKDHSINLVVDESKVLEVDKKNISRNDDLLEGIFNLTFESSNELVVTVDKNGKLKARKEGTAVITVIDELGEQDHAYVTVSDDDIYLFNHEYRLEEGDISKIEYELNSIKYKSNDIKWKSSNNSVVKVGKDGVIQAVGEGDAYITVEINKDISKKVKVVVYNEIILPTNLQVSSNDIKISVGDSLQLSATVEPLNATDKKVTYSSSDPSIVTVSQDGTVIGKANGKAVISVVTVNGIKKDIPVLVNEKIISVTDVLVYKSVLNLLVGDTSKIEYKILPESATDKRVKFIVDGNCISVDKDGNIKALSPGVAHVTVSSMNGYSSVLTVQVASKSTDNNKISSVKINEGDLTLSVGIEKQLTTTIYPTGVKIKSQQWTSSNPLVASVDKNGKVKALSNGNTVITYQVNDYKCSIKLEVTTPKVFVKKIELNKEKLELKVGKKETLLASITPSNATNPNITWVSSNPDVASVDSNGKVVAIDKGTSTITAISNDNSEIMDTCVVSVTYNVSIQLDKDEYNLVEGNSVEIHASVVPSKASQELLFSSNNTDVAVVDSNGKVVAKSPGTAYIEITSLEDANVKVNCKIVVIAKTEVSGLVINESDNQLSFNSTYQLSTTISPSNATNKDVKWISSDTELAEVDNKGLVKIKQKMGKVTITAKSDSNSSVLDSINLWIVKENSKIDIENVEKLEKYKEIMTYNFDSNNEIEKSYRAIQSFAIRNFGSVNEEVVYLMTKVNNPVTIDELGDAKTSIIFTVGSGSSNKGDVSYSTFLNGGHGQTLEFIDNNLFVTCDGKFVSNGKRIQHQSHCLIPYLKDSSVVSSTKKISYVTTKEGFSLYQEGMSNVTNPDLAIDTKNNLAAVVDQYKYLYIFKWDELQKSGVDAKYLIRKKLNVRNVQSLTIHNGYIYALDSPSRDDNGVSYPIRVHRYDLFGNVVTSIDLWTDPVKTSSVKQEGEGIKIYNNKIYLAVFQPGYNFSIYKMS